MFLVFYLNYICLSIYDSLLKQNCINLQVTDLKPDTSYVFLVRAENSQGLSLPGPLSDVAHTVSANQHTVPQIELIRARDRLNSEILHLREVQALSSSSVKIIWDVSIIYSLCKFNLKILTFSEFECKK